MSNPSTTEDLGRRVLEVSEMLMKLDARGEAVAAARRVKEAMAIQMNRISLLNNTLDHLIASFAPGPDWVYGFLTVDAATGQIAQPAPTRLPRYDRQKQTLQAASELSSDAKRMAVFVSEVIAKLREKGEDLADKPLATAVGNILTRSGSWRRLGPGEYKKVFGIRTNEPLNGREASDVERSQVV